MTDHLSLKWGTLKSWSVDDNEIAMKLLKEYLELGASMSAMAQHDTAKQKEIICKIIDAVDCDKIYLDWDGEYVSKEEAKTYVMTY